MSSGLSSLIYNKALDILSRREHSEHELKLKLYKKFEAISDSEIEEVITKLESNNLLSNDTKNASDHFPIVADFALEFYDDNIENNEIECFNYNVNLNQGWNLIGFGCDSNSEAQVVFLPIIHQLIIAKDGFGNAYLPEWNFNGLGNLERGFGYQIKITEGIGSYNICNY